MISFEIIVHLSVPFLFIITIAIKLRSALRNRARPWTIPDMGVFIVVLSVCNHFDWWNQKQIMFEFYSKHYSLQSLFFEEHQILLFDFSCENYSIQLCLSNQSKINNIWSFHLRLRQAFLAMKGFQEKLFPS